MQQMNELFAALRNRKTPQKQKIWNNTNKNNEDFHLIYTQIVCCLSALQWLVPQQIAKNKKEEIEKNIQQSTAEGST